MKIFDDKNRRSGYILYELLVSVALIIILLTGWLRFVNSELILMSTIKDQLEFLNNQRYTRQFISQKIRETKISSFRINAKSIQCETYGNWCFLYNNQRIFRKLSNGEMQPLSGLATREKAYNSRIYKIDNQDIFTNDNNLICLRWQGNKLLSNYLVEAKILPDGIYYNEK